LATKTAPRRTSRRHAPQTTRPKKKRGFFRRFWWLWAPPVVLTVAFFSALAYVYSKLPLDLDIPEAQTSFLFDRDNEPLTTFDKGIDRRKIELEDMPGHLIQAVIAAEDERFYQHGGVSIAAIIRAAWANITGGHIEQGGSTITQQYVRNVFPEVGTERTITRKIKEVLLAIKLEHALSKNEILERYLNTIYLGEGAYGVEAAAQTYFGVHARNLDVPQAATIAGLIAGPETFDPHDNPSDATVRRDYVLDRMAQLGFITPAEVTRYEAHKVHAIEPPNPYEELGGTAYYVDYTKRWLERRYHGKTFRGGLRVRGTIDQQWQHAAEQAVRAHLSLAPGTPAAALVAVDVDNGEVRAMVGGQDFEKAQFNLATGQGGTGRQAGSAFKPFTLATAIEQHISLNSTFSGPSQIDLSDEGCGQWEPHNYGDTSYGTMNLLSATANSVNTIFAQLVVEVGPKNVARTAHAMGIKSPLEDRSGYVPCSITLGTKEVTPLEMASAFATFSTGGTRHYPTPVQMIKNRDGKVIYRNGVTANKGKQVISKNTAWQAIFAMKHVLTEGTAAGNYPGFPSWGKTGTTDDLADVWFCGSSSEVAACVWAGHIEGRVPMPGASGGGLAAPIWRDFMVAINGGGNTRDWPTPQLTGELLQGTPTPVASPPPAPTTEPVPTQEPTREPQPEPTRTRPPKPTEPPPTTPPPSPGTGRP
jgi:penicillin-binding protein 1A